MAGGEVRNQMPSAVIRRFASPSSSVLIDDVFGKYAFNDDMLQKSVPKYAYALPLLTHTQVPEGTGRQEESRYPAGPRHR